MPDFFFFSLPTSWVSSTPLVLFRLAAKKDRYWWNFFMGKRFTFWPFYDFRTFNSISKYIFFPLILHKENLYDIYWVWITSGTCYIHPIVLFMRKELSTTSFDSSFFHVNICVRVMQLELHLWSNFFEQHIYDNETYEVYNFPTLDYSLLFFDENLHSRKKKRNYLFLNLTRSRISLRRIKISPLNNYIHVYNVYTKWNIIRFFEDQEEIKLENEERNTRIHVISKCCRGSDEIYIYDEDKYI